MADKSHKQGRWRRSPSLMWLLCAVSLISLSGASCPQMVQQYRLPAVSAQARALTLDELALRINENSNRVQTLSSTSATLSGHQFPTLHARIALERPRRFRLLAEKTGFTGAELDLGSNDELFWFWVKRSEPPALYYCRHELFEMSAARQVFPVEPEWLLDAMGLVQINPAEVTYGPSPVGNARLRVEMTTLRHDGPRRRVIVFDEPAGHVVEQHVYDANGQLVATAKLSGHTRDAASGAILPKVVEIQWPTSQFDMRIQLNDVSVNQLKGDPVELWSKPEYRGWAEVDLADPRTRLSVPTAHTADLMPETPGAKPWRMDFWRRR